MSQKKLRNQLWKSDESIFKLANGNSPRIPWNLTSPLPPTHWPTERTSMLRKTETSLSTFLSSHGVMKTVTFVAIPRLSTAKFLPSWILKANMSWTRNDCARNVLKWQNVESWLLNFELKDALFLSTETENVSFLCKCTSVGKCFYRFQCWKKKSSRMLLQFAAFSVKSVESYELLISEN